MQSFEIEYQYTKFLQQIHLIEPVFPFSISSKTAIIISVYEDPIQPQQAASVVEKLGDYLFSCGL